MASSAQPSDPPPTQPDQNEQQTQQPLVLSEQDYHMMANDPAESLIDESEFEIVNKVTGDNSGDELDNEPSAAPAWSLQQSINLTTMNTFPESLQLNSLSHVVNGMPASMAASITTLTSSTVNDENVDKSDAMVQSSVDTPVLQASMVGPSESASIVHLQHDEAEAQHNMASEQEEFRSACASPTIQTISQPIFPVTSTISSTDTINDTLHKQKETRQILLDAIATLTSLSDEEIELTRELVNEDVPLEQQIEMVRDSAEIISKENSLLKEANDTLIKERDGIQKLYEEAQKKLEKANDEILKLNADIISHKMEISNLKAQSSSGPSLVMVDHVSQSVNPNLAVDAASLNKQLEERNKTIEQLKLQLDEATARYLAELDRRKEAENKGINSRWDMDGQFLARQLSDKHDYAVALEDELKKVRTEISALQDQLNHAKEDLGTKEEIIKVLQEDHTEGTRQLAEKDMQLKEKDVRLAEVHRVLQRFNLLEVRSISQIGKND
ncbi:hypothetical protein WR25_11969 [Diploscapter pachys]|uniref:TATA element modulatory factor 1 TATA binding domain-containing protein n=1 Tax=Diploscapter pachys TaxID=2018661 RepID=A0A2A2KWW4_9BILA|nr:hypothetical protein WR25_11969 [Diploscapter pachys]